MSSKTNTLTIVALVASMCAVVLVAVLIWHVPPHKEHASTSGIPPIEVGPSEDGRPRDRVHDSLDPVPYVREDSPPAPDTVVSPVANVRVQSEQGVPVAGAMVFGRKPAAGTDAWTHMGVTGEDGLSTLDLHKLPVLVRVVAKGYQPLDAAIESAPVDLIVLTLGQGARIEGHVVEAGTSLPVEGATVVAWPLGKSPPPDMERAIFTGAFPGGFRSVSGPDGSFSLDGLAPGETYSIAAAATGFVAASLAEAVAPSDSEAIKVTPLYALVARLVHSDGKPIRIDTRLAMWGVDHPPDGSKLILENTPLQAWHVLPDSIRIGETSGRLLVYCFSKPGGEQRIGPCTFHARLVGLGDAVNRDTWAYRVSADIPIQDIVFERASAGHGFLRFVIDHDSVKSFRKADVGAHLGELTIRTENVGSLQSIVGIDQLDESGALEIGPIPEGLYLASFKTSHNHFFCPDASKGYKWRVHIVDGKTTELTCRAVGTGSISWRIADSSEPRGEILIEIVDSRLNATGFWSTIGIAGKVPLLPPGPYGVKLRWRAERSPAHAWTDVGTAEVVVESGKVTEVVFEK